jgi:hypothetical protein
LGRLVARIRAARERELASRSWERIRATNDILLEAVDGPLTRGDIIAVTGLPDSTVRGRLQSARERAQRLVGEPA